MPSLSIHCYNREIRDNLEILFNCFILWIEKWRELTHGPRSQTAGADISPEPGFLIHLYCVTLLNIQGVLARLTSGWIILQSSLKIFESPTIASNWLLAVLYIEKWCHAFMLGVDDVFVFIQILFPWPVFFMTNRMSFLKDHFWSIVWPVSVTSQVCLGLITFSG